jgi:choline dehydrogenase-like flavoprotein
MRVTHPAPRFASDTDTDQEVRVKLTRTLVAAGAVASVPLVALALHPGHGQAQAPQGRTVAFDVTLRSQHLIASQKIALLTATYADTTGKRAGSDAETCPVYRSRPLTLQCTITAHLQGGQLAAVGLIHPQRLPYTMAVVGGTGSYDGASGTLTVSPGKSRRSERFTFMLDSR